MKKLLICSLFAGVAAGCSKNHQPLPREEEIRRDYITLVNNGGGQINKVSMEGTQINLYYNRGAIDLSADYLIFASPDSIYIISIKGDTALQYLELMLKYDYWGRNFILFNPNSSLVASAEYKKIEDKK